MDLKTANCSFHYSERLKSNFFLIAGMVDRLSGLDGERLEGGKEVARSILVALRGELNLAKQYLPVSEISVIEGKIMEVSGEIELCNYGRAQERLGEALSRVTTLSERYMQALKQANWV